MGRSNSFSSFYEAISMQALPLFNIVYADKFDTIFYISAGKMPLRNKENGYTWNSTLPGNTSATLWHEFHPIADLPQYTNPASGYLFNTNHSPFLATATKDNLNPEKYDKTSDYEMYHNNRSQRFTELITPFEKFIRKASITLEGTQYGAPGNQNYKKIKTGVDIYFRNKKANSSLTQKLSGNYFTASSLYQIELEQKAEMNSFLQFGYRLEQLRLINPFSLQASLETGKSHQKTSVELNYKVSYSGQNQGLGIRLFSGTILKKDSEIPFFRQADGVAASNIFTRDRTPTGLQFFPITSCHDR